jgi:N-acetylmuramic acid 6-phosphate etherase
MSLNVRPTEDRNPASEDIDLLSTTSMLRLINQQDQLVPLAVSREVPRIARAVEAVADALRHGGRLIYVGAGTSGRLGFLDASECTPTFNIKPSQVIAVLAGGMRAVGLSSEDAEDDASAGVADLKKKKVDSRDVVVGIAASGQTPYTLGAMRYGKKRGARIVSVTCNPQSEMAAMADISIAPEVGPEVITGSTRLKCGTAQKLVLNMISTGAMIRLGRVYSHWMIDMQMKNAKLRARGRGMVMAIAGVDEKKAALALKKAKGDLKTAVVMLRLGVTARSAQQILENHQRDLRKALK